MTRLCRGSPHCPHPAGPSGYCTRCRPQFTGYQLDKRTRGSSRKRQYDYTWEKYARRYKLQHILCAFCQARGVPSLVTVVDHIIPLSLGGSKLDPRNHQPLCNACHAYKTHEEARGRLYYVQGNRLVHLATAIAQRGSMRVPPEPPEPTPPSPV